MNTLPIKINISEGIGGTYTKRCTFYVLSDDTYVLIVCGDMHTIYFWTFVFESTSVDAKHLGASLSER